MLERSEQALARTVRYWGSVYVVLVLLLTAAAVYTFAVSLWRGPWRDMWEVMPFLQKAWAGEAGWADYWEQYGYSHRPLLSRWLWVKDMQWAAGSNLLLLAVSVLMQGVIYCSVRAVLRRDQHLDAWQRGVVLCGVVFCLYNITQVFNFLHTFDVQWFLVTGFVVLSLERLLAGATTQRMTALLLACVALAVAGLNNFSALVMWPVALLLLVVLGYSRQHILCFVALAGAYLSFYFHGLPASSGTALLLSGDTLVERLRILVQLFVIFPLWYLANPLSFQLAQEGPLQMPQPVGWLAPLLVALLLCAVARAWCLGVLRRKTFSGVGWLGLALALYGYGVAVVTALGRGLFWDNVYALRYQNIVLLFWIGIVLWLASSERRRYLGLFGGALLLLVIFASRAGWYHELMLKTGNRTRDAHLALVVGLENELSAIQATVSRSRLGPDSTYTLAQEAAFLRSIRVGPYADDAWQVPPLTALASVQPCAVPVSRVDVRGERYARLSVDFAQPVKYRLIAWFDSDPMAPGLLIAERADTVGARVQQSLHGFTGYAGFARSMPVLKPDQLFAGSAEGWCRLQ